MSGSMTLPRTEYGAAEQNSGTDTLGRSWGSRFGLSAVPEQAATLSRATNDGGQSSRWKRIRGALFHSHGRSFSPSSHQISSIEEGMEIPPMVILIASLLYTARQLGNCAIVYFIGFFGRYLPCIERNS